MPNHKSTTTSSIPALSEAEFSRIEQATAEYDWETVRELVAEALELPDLTTAEEYRLLDARVKANQYLGGAYARLADVQRMLELAKAMGDNAAAVRALGKMPYEELRLNDPSAAQSYAEEALQLANEAGDQELQARAHNTLAFWASLSGDSERMESHHRQALLLSKNGVSAVDEIWALRELSQTQSSVERPQRAAAYAQQALALARTSGDRLGELFTLAVISNSNLDLATQRHYLRQARDVAKTINNNVMLANIETRLAMSNWRFGLYWRSLTNATESIRLWRRQGQEMGAVWTLGILASAAEGAGEIELARETYEELEDKAHTAHHLNFLAKSMAGLGRLALRAGDLDQAAAKLSDAAAIYKDSNHVNGQANTLAWLAAVRLARGELLKASEISANAFEINDRAVSADPDYPIQDFWWLTYQVLVQNNEPGDDAWSALDAARLAMFEPVATIGDEGLRRNYLNKPPFHRAICETWAREAVVRGLSLDVFSQRETAASALSEQLERIVESGSRLAAERDTESLANFILQEFVELSGVERAVIALREPGKKHSYVEAVAVPYPAHFQWAAIEGFADGEETAVAAFAHPFIEQAEATRAPLLVDAAGEALGDGIPELRLRSALALPMISEGRLWGVLYGDMRHLFGRLNENDRDVLSLLANQAGAALENANWMATLEEQVRDRTAEAEAAREEAERANKAKSAFMSSLSHELRTPLNAIMGFTRIVKRKTEDRIPQKQTENLDKVLSSGEHLLGLINTILDIAKIEAGRMDVIVSRFHIGQLIEAAKAVSQPLLRPGVDLNLNIALGLPEINSDQDKIKQILLNLLSNAAKFTHEGSISVSAGQESDTLIISVADTGIGMDEEALGRVFEEFQQADLITRKKYGGTGLGMPISRHLAQLLGGDLTVTSTDGEGSTFTLTLPIERDTHS